MIVITLEYNIITNNIFWCMRSQTKKHSMARDVADVEEDVYKQQQLTVKSYAKIGQY